MATLIGKRVLGIALGYAEFKDHDVLDHGPTMAALTSKLTRGTWFAHRGRAVGVERL